MHTKLVYCFPCYLALEAQNVLHITMEQRFWYLEQNDGKIRISKNAPLCWVSANLVTFLKFHSNISEHKYLSNSEIFI